MPSTIRIENAGVSVLTDLGRTRGPRMGLPVNGALDRYSARVANVLVRNDESTPLIEITAQGFAMTVEDDALLAVTGADVRFLVDGVQRPTWQPVFVLAGQTVEVLDMSAGIRSYIAVHGSFQAALLLGSCAPDTVIGFGHRLANSDRLVANEATHPLVNPYFGVSLFDVHPTATPAPSAEEGAVIDVTDGPDIAEFGDTQAQLFEEEYTVSPRSNHIGLRVGGFTPKRAASGELLSRGVPVGAVEVPPGDELLILHRGRGVTAGYPVLAVVTTTSLDVLAQSRPGQRIRFRRITRSAAVEQARRQHAQIDMLRTRVENAFAALTDLSTGENRAIR